MVLGQAATAQSVSPPTVASSDGRAVVALGTTVQDQPSYTVSVDGRLVIAPSALGCEFERYAKLADGLRIERVESSQGEDRCTLPAGKVWQVAQGYGQIVVHSVEKADGFEKAGGIKKTGARRRLDLMVRAYDSGIALRYAVPKQPGLTKRHHLLLDLQGATHPWGMTRTWPNFLTQEGVLGGIQEVDEADHRASQHHARLYADAGGPDGLYTGRLPERHARDLRDRRHRPADADDTRRRTRQFVVFESPLQSVADTPDAYRGQKGLDFLRAVPASWDETRFLQGTLGADIAIARRRGRRW